MMKTSGRNLLLDLLGVCVKRNLVLGFGDLVSDKKACIICTQGDLGSSVCFFWPNLSFLGKLWKKSSV